MKKSFVKTVCGIVLAGVMLAATGCSMPGASAEDSIDTNANVVEASDGEGTRDSSLAPVNPQTAGNGRGCRIFGAGWPVLPH